MTHLVKQLRDEADTEIAAMRTAALHARDTHARAELMRHMLMTASNVVRAIPVPRPTRYSAGSWTP